MIMTVYFLLTKILQAMRNYGYEIVETLIVDIERDETVKRAMNEINAGEETHVSLLCPFVPGLINQEREMVFFNKSSFS
jgi:hypothetical protein